MTNNASYGASPDAPLGPRPIGRLALADGSIFTGHAFGAVGRGIVAEAEVVFNTAMCGYQESLTDPSYCGQILVETAPLVGNTGVNAEDVESARVQVAGFVVRELARSHSNYRATSSLENYLADAGVLALTGVDTRAITRRIRARGAMPGVITDRTDLTDAELVARARAGSDMSGQNLVPKVGCSSGQTWSETLGDWSPEAITGLHRAEHAGPRPVVLALDCGAKRNILRHLTDRGLEVRVVPHTTPAAEIVDAFRAGEVQGLFVSNGPGDPAAVEAVIGMLRDVIRAEPPIPVFGICLGHQLLALAAGAKTFKLKFGHRGANQPVREIDTGRIEITSQNHGFAVDPDSLGAVGGRATHVHLNDGTLAGFELSGRPVFAVQYHPEASPGPHDSAVLFDRFADLVRQCGETRAAATV
ncbi:MAG: glutamine-hydrolyzing carbamoyl-phosphate synthase small subunit [Phycisphaerales bacterium]|jgi:carbamoyl-phosphate synthase small subunit|nr:glutamine-hydrolyzing carbamoyl-phosphate synthase small subunit [Phycisphaerales bacterium]